MGLEFKIVYKQGKENTVTDSLSRVGYLMALQAVATVQAVCVSCPPACDGARECVEPYGQ
jgi:hypothetical protein